MKLYHVTVVHAYSVSQLNLNFSNSIFNHQNLNESSLPIDVYRIVILLLPVTQVSVNIQDGISNPQNLDIACMQCVLF